MSGLIPGVTLAPISQLAAMSPRQRDEYAAAIYTRGRRSEGDVGGEQSEQIVRLTDSLDRARISAVRRRERIKHAETELVAARIELASLKARLALEPDSLHATLERREALMRGDARKVAS